MFSVIMPAFNAGNMISASIKSVVEQTISDWEMIVIDDCSTDNTIKEVLAFSDNRIKLLQNANNKGVALSRNEGLKIAKGKYIAFLDSDDLWEENKLEKQLKILESGFNIVCGSYYTFSQQQQPLSVRKSKTIISYSDMLKSNFIGNLTGCYNADVCGIVMQQQVGHEDYLMWLELISKFGPAFSIEDVIAGYRVSSSSLSAKKTKAMKWQWIIYRKHLKLSLIKSIYYFFQYITHALLKRS